MIIVIIDLICRFTFCISLPEETKKVDDSKKKSDEFLSQLYIDMNLDDLTTKLRNKNMSVVNQYYYKLRQVMKVVESIRNPTHGMFSDFLKG